MTPDLSLIPKVLHQMATEDLNRGDMLAFLGRASNELSVALLSCNSLLLKERGLLEEAFRCAMTATRTNNRWDYAMIRSLVDLIDREKLMAVGTPPGLGPWTLFRGVGGRGKARRIRGYSWTADIELARWFARRAASAALPDAAVYETTVGKEQVLFCCDDRQEREFFLILPTHHSVRRIERIEVSM